MRSTCGNTYGPKPHPLSSSHAHILRGSVSLREYPYPALHLDEVHWNFRIVLINCFEGSKSHSVERWKICLEVVEDRMGLAVSSLFIKKYFMHDSKAEVGFSLQTILNLSRKKCHKVGIFVLLKFEDKIEMSHFNCRPNSKNNDKC